MSQPSPVPATSNSLLQRLAQLGAWPMLAVLMAGAFWTAYLLLGCTVRHFHMAGWHPMIRANDIICTVSGTAALATGSIGGWLGARTLRRRSSAVQVWLTSAYMAAFAFGGYQLHLIGLGLSGNGLQEGFVLPGTVPGVLPLAIGATFGLTLAGSMVRAQRRDVRGLPMLAIDRLAAIGLVGVCAAWWSFKLATGTSLSEMLIQWSLDPMFAVLTFLAMAMATVIAWRLAPAPLRSRVELAAAAVAVAACTVSFVAFA